MKSLTRRLSGNIADQLRQFAGKPITGGQSERILERLLRSGIRPGRSTPGAGIFRLLTAFVCCAVSALAGAPMTGNLPAIVRSSSPVSGPALLPDGNGALDTLRWDSGQTEEAFGQHPYGGTFYGAVRFTPDRNCTLTNVLWYNRDRADSAKVLVWGAGTDSVPGRLIETVISAVGEQQLIDVAIPPISLPAGTDFWVGVRVTHAAGRSPLGIDAGPQVRRRGGYISTDGQNWDELYQLSRDLDRNWVIRAVIIKEIERLPDDVGVSKILAPAGMKKPGTVITPLVEMRNFGTNPQSDIPVYMLVEAAGTEVYFAEAVHTGSVIPGESAVVGFTPDWNALEGSYEVTSWTLLPGDENPANDTMRTTVEITWQAKDTLRWDSGQTEEAFGQHPYGGTFYGAARFTPDDNCILTNVLWYNRDRADSAKVLVWGPGTDSVPGRLIETVISAVGEQQLIDVAIPPISLPAGTDFWVGVRVTHAAGRSPLGIDAGPQVRRRGGYISTDGQNWDELYQLSRDLDRNWVIRAVGRAVPSAVTELLPAATGYLQIEPNPLAGGMATLRFEGLGRNSESRKDSGYVPRLTLTVFDVTGRSVLSRNVATAQSGAVSLDLRELSAGIYLLQVEAEGFSGTQKLVVQR